MPRLGLANRTADFNFISNTTTVRGPRTSNPSFSLSTLSKTENSKSCFFIYLCCCLPLFYLAWVNRHYQLDDALIYLRYVRNFLNGEGLVYNEGVYFNGLTSPLYSYLLILLGTLISNLQVATILLAALLHACLLYTSDAADE